HPYQPPLYGAVAGTGSGGLGTVMELVLGLGGTAVVRADPDGKGKSIWITLPL
ncbi:ATP-binding protein, partial [Streptomyces sp. NPDC002586]